MKEEYLDILSEKGEPMGVSRTSSDAHTEGLIHRAVHVWLVNSQKCILLQKRAAEKEAYPNYWDISASGHVSAGQTSIEGAQMETKEELGLSLPASAFIYFATFREQIILNNNTYINKEFQDIYIVRMDVKLSNMHFDHEVSELKWVGLQEFKQLSLDKESMLVPHAEEYSRLVAYLEDL
jgi:isopentenyl-diphosphate delta-isomerase type 1